jgi:hypothetical protein
MNALETHVDESVVIISNIEDDPEVFQYTDNIYTQIANIKSWSSSKINEIEKQEMLEVFLAQMRGLFIEYGAKLEIVSAAEGVGYGLQYGEGGASESAGFKLTIEKEGLTVSKIYETMILQGDNI